MNQTTWMKLNKVMVKSKYGYGYGCQVVQNISWQDIHVNSQVGLCDIIFITFGAIKENPKTQLT